jgi:fermentation-respiration switch protein FrsA (DUF1100 family)
VSAFLKRVWKVAQRALRVALVLWVPAVVVLGFLQRKMMYQPSVTESLPVADHGFITRLFPDSSDVEFGSSNGQTIRAWYLCQDAATVRDRPLVLFLHGNGGNRAGRAAWYELLKQLSCDVLAIDYQGYGDSSGKPTQANVENDSVTAWIYAVERLGYTPDEIIIMGTSLGGAAAVHVAATQCYADAAPAGLITVSSFSSMLAVASSKYRWVPVKAILLDQYPSSDKIADVTSPFIHIHGDADQVVEQRFGRQLFEAAPDESASGTLKRWVSLADVGHNDVVHTAGELVRKELAVFLESVAAGVTER